MGLVTMSPRELERLALKRRIAERRTTQRMAAEQLGLTVRQVERLYAAFKAHGAEGLVSRKRGAPSNCKLSPDLRELAMKLARGQYADFGPTLAQEKLIEVHGIPVSVTTMRKPVFRHAASEWRRRRPSPYCRNVNVRSASAQATTLPSLREASGTHTQAGRYPLDVPAVR